MQIRTEAARRTPEAPTSPPAGFSRVRARARARTGIRLAVLAVALVALFAGATLPGSAARTSDAHAATTTTIPASVPALGARWFALGANVPYIAYRCDFGCGLGRGVRGNSATADAMLRSMSRRGVRVVRWYLFPDTAWQVRRAGDGTPTGVAPAALLDLDAAARLAAKHDVFLLPVVLPDPAELPATWFTDATQAAALAATLRPMFARYRGNPHVLGWELATGAERLVDSGVATRDQVRAHVAALRGAMRAAAPGRLAVVGTTDVTRIDTWTGLGADAYLPQDPDNLPADRCACPSVAALVTSEGLDAPVIVGGFQATSTAAALRRLDGYADRGYAGALAWAWRGTAHPANPGVAAPMQDDATWHYHHDRPGSGPRSRPLNPCYGPDESTYRCPNLQMAPPRSVSLGRLGRRTVLFSTNSLDSVGRGPASLRGTRDGRYTMAARQVLHRRDGRRISIDTGAKLLFKAIPGQYRYWKWNGAAQMELWRLDSTGRPIQRAKVGPKTVYCLRDLTRTHGFLPGSPRGRVYPACSQSLSRRDVTLGTSVGWSDVYPASYHENWIDVTGLRGCFAYVHIADPTNVIYEDNEDDNTSNVVVKLPWRGTNRGCPGAKPIPTIGANGTY